MLRVSRNLATGLCVLLIVALSACTSEATQAQEPAEDTSTRLEEAPGEDTSTPQEQVPIFTVPQLGPAQHLAIEGSALDLAAQANRLCVIAAGSEVCAESAGLKTIIAFAAVGTPSDSTKQHMNVIYMYDRGTVAAMAAGEYECIWCGDVRVCGRNPNCGVN